MLGEPIQIAYAVNDVEAAARTWENLGAGPFFIRHHIELTGARLDGKPGRFDHSAAYGQWGEVMVELIEVHVPAGTPLGLHHVAFFVDDLAEATAALADRGWPEAIAASTPTGSTFIIHDARAELGHYVEIYEETDSIARLYAMVRKAAAERAR